MKLNNARRKREKAELRLAILDAARELFLSGGEDAVTLRSVAERIEYSATTIYQHFPSKEVLIQELCLADFEAYSRVLKQAERFPDPLTRLRRIAAAYVDFGILYPAHYRAMFMTPPGAKPAVADPQSGTSSMTEAAGTNTRSPHPAPPNPYEFLHTVVFKAMAAGCFRPPYRDVALIAQVIWTGLHGVISLHLVRARYSAVTWRPIQAAAHLMVEGLINGLTNEVP